MRLFLLCIILASVITIKFSVIQSYSRLPPTLIPSEEVLRSYRPHFMHSYSYPQPVTPHIYYGQVIGNKPQFLVKDMINKSQSVTEILMVDQLQEKGSYDLSYQKQHKQLIISKYMLSIQMENMLSQPMQYQLSMKNTGRFYQVIIQYQRITKQYVLFFSHNNQIFDISQESMKGLKHRVIDQAASNPQQAWNLPNNLYWSGNGQPLRQQKSFKGIVIEIEYAKSTDAVQIKMHLKQIYLKQSKLLTFQQLAKKVSISHRFWENKNKKTTCAQDAVDKLKYGLSYQYGTLQITNRSVDLHNDPKGLLSFSPSRTRFPWGFLWDDGFHCEVAVRSDSKLAIKVIKSWLDTILDSGWIPREQNRGAEREYLCSCPRFMKKDVNDGNPPTLILALDYLRKEGKLNQKIFPRSYWEKVKRWHRWFLNTQKSQTNEYLYKWNDSIQNNGSFTSGMDDFPRMVNAQAHVDIQAWMYFFTSFMKDVSKIYQPNSSSQYEHMVNEILSNINKFIDLKDNICKDFDKSGNFSNFVGYPSLLPLAFGMLKYGSDAYNATIKLIVQRMDSGFGINSITMDSELSFTGDAYWRGPVWININYLVVRGLKLYYPQENQLYNKLRTNLLDTVCGNWENTGYFYENYIKGKGSFAFPFNGWTSLISIIHSQQY